MEAEGVVVVFHEPGGFGVIAFGVGAEDVGDVYGEGTIDEDGDFGDLAIAHELVDEHDQLLRAADGGLLFLDEIEGLSPTMQAKLLRVVEEREIWPVGAAEPRHLDLRIIAASKIDLANAVRDGAFRADLYYRLNVVTLVVPPLRERREDVPTLFGHFLAEAAARLRRPAPRLTATIRDHLLGHDWPGNVRELAHYAERVALGLPSAVVAEDGAAQGSAESLADRTGRYEAMVIRETLAACGGDARTAMTLLQTPRKTFYDKLRRHGIEIDRYRPGKG